MTPTLSDTTPDLEEQPRQKNSLVSFPFSKLHWFFEQCSKVKKSLDNRYSCCYFSGDDSVICSNGVSCPQNHMLRRREIEIALKKSL